MSKLKSLKDLIVLRSLLRPKLTVTRVALISAVSRLEEAHRDVVSRKHFGGFSGDEIAEQLGVAPGTVRSRLSRAYARLRRMVEISMSED